MDGVAIGRPCCGLHNCQNPLPSQRARFCSVHAAMDNICSVIDCTRSVTTGFRTCDLPHHRSIEDTSKNAAIFVLRPRLERYQMSTMEDDGIEGTVSEEFSEFDTEGECPSKAEEGNTVPRARLGRRRSHNEQLVVCTCGVIIGRATMFGSEGISSAKVCSERHTISLLKPLT